MRRWARRLVGLAAALGLAAAIVAAAGSPAAAHANLVATSPPNGSELDRPPEEIRLRFSERVTVVAGGRGVEVRDGDGGEVSAEPAAVAAEDPTTVVVRLTEDLAEGGYLVSFRVLSADSHPVAGAFTFGVGTAAGTAGDLDAATGDPAVPAVFALARWTSYAGLALLAGGLAMFALCWPGGWADRRARRLVLVGWVASLAGAVAVLLLQGPYAVGRPLPAITDPALLPATLDTDYGRYVLLRLGVVALATVLVFGPRRAARPPWWAGAGALTVGVLLPATWIGTGHANTADNPWDRLAATGHLVAMSTWFGGLAVLVACLLPRSSAVPAGEVAPALRRFSLLATTAVATLLASGGYVAWRQVGTLDALFGTPYGRLLAFKVAVMGVLLWLGALSRSVVQRRYAEAAPELAGAGGAEPASRSKRRAARAAGQAERADRNQLGRSVRLETGAAVAVLAVASVLVATPPGVVATAAALGTGQAEPVLAEEWLEGRDGAVQVLVDPAWVGDNRVVIEVVDATGRRWDVPEVRASFVLPDGELGPLPVELTESSPGVYRADGSALPVAGDWQLDVSVRTSEIDITSVQFAVPVT